MSGNNGKNVADMVTERLQRAKTGQVDPTISTVFTRENEIHLRHNGHELIFTPEQAIVLSEAIMTAGWELKEEIANEREESGEPVKDNGDEG